VQSVRQVLFALHTNAPQLVAAVWLHVPLPEQNDTGWNVDPLQDAPRPHDAVAAASWHPPAPLQAPVLPHGGHQALTEERNAVTTGTGKDDAEFLAAIATDQVDKTIDTITTAAKTGQIGDGKIFVLTLDTAVLTRVWSPGGDLLTLPLSTDGEGVGRIENTDGFPPLRAGVSYARQTGVEHDVINPNGFEFVFVEIELKA